MTTRGVGKIGWVQIDCRDPDALRSFWAELLGLAADHSPAPPEFRCLAPSEPGGVGVCFQRVPEPKVVKNRVHLDVAVADIAAATALVEHLGGSRYEGVSDYHEGDWHWRRMVDPEGNEFCLVPRTDDPIATW